MSDGRHHHNINELNLDNKICLVKFLLDLLNPQMINLETHFENK